jgi:hypothetical protein
MAIALLPFSYSLSFIAVPCADLKPLLNRPADFLHVGLSISDVSYELEFARLNEKFEVIQYISTKRDTSAIALA